MSGDPTRSTPPAETLTYTRKVLIAVGISVAALLLTAFVYYTTQLLIICFAGLLLAAFLSAPTDLLAKYARIKRSYALGIVVAALVCLVLGGGYLMGSRVYQQAIALSRTIPGAMKQLERDLYKYMPAPREIDEPATTSAPATEIASVPPDTQSTTVPATAPANWLADKLIQIRDSASDFLFSESFVKGAGGVVTSTFGILGNVVIILGVGLFFAISPGTYASGALLLFPPTQRQRAASILSLIRVQLQWWFVGQLCSMITVAILAFIGLSILGVPLAFTLAILAGLLNFVPYVGPIVAAVPAVLVAFAPRGDETALNPSLAFWTIILYLIIQSLDGWVFTPFYQKRAVNIPPALIIIAQLTFSLLLGPLGLILATPILASILVLIRTVYIEDVLGDRPHIPPVPPAAPTSS